MRYFETKHVTVALIA